MMLLLLNIDIVVIAVADVVVADVAVAEVVIAVVTVVGGCCRFRSCF